MTSESGPGNEERTRIAASVLLLEAAYADHKCTEEELDHVIATLRSDFNLSQAHAEDLLELAHRERSQAVDLYEFTNHINNEFSKQEKKAVLEAVWRIIHIDGQLEKHEDHFARKLTHLLRLTHKDMIDAKLKAREQLQ
ncbi:MAG: TerB family tellurite resistance protein [Desulfobulbales bacterium]|nr:TerB family tellurite resistance protein [Desulfobulbales bacterium]